MNRGEQAAAALEANLTSLESKLDELLASFDVPADEESVQQPNDTHEKRSSAGKEKETKEEK